MNALVAEQTSRLETIRTLLMRDQRVFAAGLLQARLHVVPPEHRVKTACTDGKDIWFNAGFAAACAGRKAVTVLCEEVVHCYAGHLWRAKGGDHTLWNRAADQEARWMMEELNARARAQSQPEPFPWPRPEDAPQDRFRGMAMESVYTILQGEAAPPDGGQSATPSPPESSGAGSGGDAGGESADPAADDTGHSPSGAAAGGPGAGATPPSASGQPAPAGGGLPPSANEHTLPSAGEAQSAGHFLPPSEEDGEAASRRTQWERTAVLAAQACQSQGDLPAALARLIDAIRCPPRDPLDQVREWMTDIGRNGYSWMRPNLRLRSACPRFILPGRWSQEAGVVVFATDTSGSIGRDQLVRFQGLKQWVLDEWSPSLLVDIYCDARVQEVREYTPGDMVPLICPGGGGTDFRPVFTRIERDYGDTCRALVFCTDLCGTFPDDAPEYPVRWVVWGRGNLEPPFGSVTPLPED